MRDAAERAIQLDPLLAEAHEALGMSAARDAHWVEAEKSDWETMRANEAISAGHASSGIASFRAQHRRDGSICDTPQRAGNEPTPRALFPARRR